MAAWHEPRDEVGADMCAACPAHQRAIGNLCAEPATSCAPAEVETRSVRRSYADQHQTLAPRSAAVPDRFLGVPAHAEIVGVEAARGAAAGADGLVALGGGSLIDPRRRSRARPAGRWFRSPPPAHAPSGRAATGCAMRWRAGRPEAGARGRSRHRHRRQLPARPHAAGA
jgi:hypothetical protein